MSRIVGVVCDHCGTLDVEINSNDRYEDIFPRNGWLSINEWGEPGEPTSDSIHICSLSCLTEFAGKALHEEQHSSERPHEHE